VCSSDLLWFRGNPAAFLETASGITLSGAGADIYLGTAEFRFAYKKLSGDGSITVRLDSAQTQASWTKCGVMIRESLDPLGMQVHMISAAQQSLVEWMYRSASNSTTTTGFNTAANSNPLPVWLRVTRTGNVFTGEYSADGKTWTKVAATDGTLSSMTITMPASVYIGMVVCSNSAGNLAVANFSQIKTSGNVTGQWQTADVGVAQPANSTEPLYVMVQDTAGKSKTIVHPNAAASSISDWTQWRIALKDFTGVNMASVKKMVIGVGDRSNPKKGGGGMLFLDDIQYGRPITPVGLVAYYKLEGDTLDSSGNGHDGVLAGNAAFPVAYVNGPTGFGKAMLFEGTQGHQYVDLGTFNPSQKTGKLSVALWAKWDGLSTAWQGLIGKRNDTWAASGMMWQIEANQTTGSLRFQREGTADIILSNAPTIGQWVHIAVTFDGAIAKGYINGAKTVEAAFTFGSNREAPIQFGTDTLGGGNSYNGTLDEIHLYDVVLTDAEVAALAGK
jgi:regulation of enolase protein 1 (concanavalin A-like superfamily)